MSAKFEDDVGEEARGENGDLSPLEFVVAAALFEDVLPIGEMSLGTNEEEEDEDDDELLPLLLLLLVLLQLLLLLLFEFVAMLLLLLFVFAETLLLGLLALFDDRRFSIENGLSRGLVLTLSGNKLANLATAAAARDEEEDGDAPIAAAMF